MTSIKPLMSLMRLWRKTLDVDETRVLRREDEDKRKVKEVVICK